MRHRGLSRALAVLTVAGLLAVGTLALAATSRLASVAPPGSLCLGGSFQVGVRFKSGTKRTYSIRVVEPTGGILFNRKGKAGTKWRRWTVTPRLAGGHRVEYNLAGKRKAYGLQVNDCNPDPGVSLTDNDGGAAALSLTKARPGEESVSCIVVTYQGNRPAPVRLYGTTTGSGLDTHLDLVVERGTLPAGTPFGSCQGFAPDDASYVGQGPGIVYTGTLRDYPDSFETGLTQPSAAWSNGEAHAYRVRVTLRNENSAQGKTAEHVFTWEARL